VSLGSLLRCPASPISSTSMLVTRRATTTTIRSTSPSSSSSPCSGHGLLHIRDPGHLRERQDTEVELRGMEEGQRKKLRSLLVLAGTAFALKCASAVAKSLQCVYSLAVWGCWKECEQRST
jgi:hypothetical protein